MTTYELLIKFVKNGWKITFEDLPDGIFMLASYADQPTAQLRRPHARSWSCTRPTLGRCIMAFEESGQAENAPKIQNGV